MDEVDLAAVDALSALYPTPIEIRALYREAGYDAPPPIANDARGVFLEIHAQSRMGGVVRFQKLVQVALKKYPHNEDLTRWVSHGGAPAPATASGQKPKPPEIGSDKASDTTNEERAARAAPPATPPGLPAAPDRSFAELLREPAARVLTASDEDLTPLQWEVEELIRRSDPLGATPREVAEAKQLLSKIQNAHGRARQLAALRQRFEAAASRADRLAILRELSDLLRLADDPDRGAAERLANEFDVALGVDVRLRKLHQDFTGVWGAKVFWLAALTLLPLFVRFRSEMLGLEVSVASLIFAAYHGLGVYLWLSVRALEDPKHFTRYERALEAERLSRMARVHGWIGLIVVVLLAMTFAVKVRIAFGDERYRLPAPNVLRALLGIPPATEDPGPERPSNFEQTSCPVRREERRDSAGLQHGRPRR